MHAPGKYPRNADTWTRTGRGWSEYCQCVCVLRVDGTWHADGARVGDAQQTDTARPRAVEYTQIRRPVPAPTA
eukprot:882547-Prymnesium_polylepis.1